jgi:hypothetical protein
VVAFLKDAASLIPRGAGRIVQGARWLWRNAAKPAIALLMLLAIGFVVMLLAFTGTNLKSDLEKARNDTSVACKDDKGAAAGPKAKRLARLQPNTSRPTMALQLDDKLSGGDDIFFQSRGRRVVARGGNLKKQVTARMLASLRKGNERLDATVDLAAGRGPTWDRVRLKVCIREKDPFTAGTYQGTVLIVGPTLAEFSYPVVVTSKWPAWVPLAILLLVVIAFMVFTWGASDPPGKTKASANVVYAVVALAAAGLTYWSVYVKNATWGEDPAAQVPALVAAALTGAVAAQQAAAKWLLGRSGAGAAASSGGKPAGEDEQTGK